MGYRVAELWRNYLIHSLWMRNWGLGTVEVFVASHNIFSLGSVAELSNHDVMSGSLPAHVHGIQVSYCLADAAGLEYLRYSRG